MYDSDLKVSRCISAVADFAEDVLIIDDYNDCELVSLKKSLEFLLSEVNKK